MPGIKEALKETIGLIDNVLFVPLPKMKSIDEPEVGDLPEFKKNLKKTIKEQLTKNHRNKVDNEFAEKMRNEFGWSALFNKYLTA